MWNLKYNTDELIYKTESGSQRTDLWLPRGADRGTDWEFGINRHGTTKWINNKVLLCDTGRY